jgi:3',5'-cyclic AMP phosphodiesterase CpdA
VTLIAHLSDLHFGRDRRDVAAALARAVNAAKPDIVAVSGDFTQRARNDQFRAARAFLESLDAPWLAVPGNHDVPLDRPAARLFRPYARYRRHIDADLEPVRRVGVAALCGVNTVNPLDWQRGRLGAGGRARLRRALGEAADAPLRVVVAHHPVVHAAGEAKATLRGADAALRTLGAEGADIVLAGHLHSWRAAAVDAHGRVIVMAQAGSGLSDRLRGDPNDFSLIRLSRDRIAVERHAVTPEGHAFERAEVAIFTRISEGWRPESPAIGSRF